MLLAARSAALPLAALLALGVVGVVPAAAAYDGSGDSTVEVPLAGVDADALAGLQAQAQAESSLTSQALAGATADSAARGLLADPEVNAAPAVLTQELEVAPFTLAAVTWDLAGVVPGSVVVDVRLREQGTWSTWQRLDSSETTDPGAAGPVTTDGTEPLLTGGADAVQVRVDTDAGTAPAELRLVLVDGGDAPVQGAAQVDDSAAAATSSPQTTAAAGGVPAPAIVSRAQWGADESLRKGSASLSEAVRAMTVHHTAGTNNYCAANAAAQVRSVYTYHTRSLGWSDIGYNFLVDRYGTVYEGRKGSIVDAVTGAHAGGFNSGTMGVSAMGNYETAAAPTAVVRAIGKVAGWKLAQYGADPAGRVTLTSAGGGTARYREGEQVTLPRVFAHREVGYTACPGVNLFSQMGAIRSIATQTAAPDPVYGPGAVPVVADIDGNGRDELGWFRDGRWAFRTYGGSVIRFGFGSRGDGPIVGDWDRDGKDEPGVFRRGTWLLRDSATSGTAERSFSFGASGDTPVAGRWGGQSRDGIGYVRGRMWYIRHSPSAGAPDHTFAYGTPTGRPVLGTWLPDGVARPGVVLGNTSHLATSILRPTAVWMIPFGRATDQVVVADWEGDGVQTPTVVRGDTFYVRGSFRLGSGAHVIRFAG